MNRRLFISWVGFVAAVIILNFLVTMVRAQEATTEPTATIATPAPGATLDAGSILAEADRAITGADRTLNAVNTLLAYTQFLGVILAILAGLAAIAGFQRNTEDRKQLQDELKSARETNDKIDDVFDAKLDEMRDANRQLTDQFNARLDDARAALDDLKETREKLQRLDSDSTKILAKMEHIEQDMQQLTNNFKREIDSALEKVRNGAEAVVLSQFAQRQIGLGNLRPAVDYLKRACDLDSENLIFQYFLGDLLVRQGQLDEGIKFLQKARASDDPSADASYAYAIRQQGDRVNDAIQRERMYSEAIDIFLRVYNVDPFLIDISGESVFGALAGTYRRQERFDKALTWYEHTRRVSPANSYPINNIALMNFRLGRKVDADTTFRRALRIADEKLAARSSDYWARFDRVTARIALDESFDVVKSDIEAALEVVPSVDPLKKFVYGLEDLRAAPKPPKAVNAAINYMETEIAQREKNGG